MKMKMKRGELLGFNSCLGYDYDKETKTINVNPEQAETVRFIFDMYVQGYGDTTIAYRLTELKKKNNKGGFTWSCDTINGIIKNEKYKGDLLLGKTFTTDPISKRRLANMGEEEQYYVSDHHEAIVSREVWDEADRIRRSRSSNIKVETDDNRGRYTRQYSFSSMCKCGYCGSKYTRRNNHAGTKHSKRVWKCMKSVKSGVAKCPHSKDVDEKVLEESFLEVFALLVDNFDDVIDVIIDGVEEMADKTEDINKINQIKKDIGKLEDRKSKMTDMLIDGTIDKDSFDEKSIDISRRIHTLLERRRLLELSGSSKSDIMNRMMLLKDTLKKEEVLKEFDRVVFDSIVKEIIVGGYDDDGNIDPYKLTFILKDEKKAVVPDAKWSLKQNKVRVDTRS